jgi:hypothetical protein
MNRTSVRRLVASLFTLLCLPAFTPAHAEQWTQPTAEELQMTSQPEVPGAAAVYLYREEKTEDKYQVFNVYIRLKVLTERGKQYGDVELTYASYQDRNSYDFRGFTVGDIAGRTIHSDGTIIPFTGKPYQKLIEKTQGSRIMAEVFSMPDVQVGSIIEYRYSLNLDSVHQIDGSTVVYPVEPLHPQGSLCLETHQPNPYHQRRSRPTFQLHRLDAHSPNRHHIAADPASYGRYNR